MKMVVNICTNGLSIYTPKIPGFDQMSGVNYLIKKLSNVYKPIYDIYSNYTPSSNEICTLGNELKYVTNNFIDANNKDSCNKHYYYLDSIIIVESNTDTQFTKIVYCTENRIDSEFFMRIKQIVQEIYNALIDEFEDQIDGTIYYVLSFVDIINKGIPINYLSINNNNVEFIKNIDILGNEDDDEEY